MNGDPTNCDRCGASLERGWSQRWRGKLLESICFDCDDAEQIKQYQDTKVLTSKVTVMAAIDGVHREHGKPSVTGYRDVLTAVSESCARIHAAIKAWERLVWFEKLQVMVQRAKFRGFRLDFTGGHALVYSLAGRTQITIEARDDSAQISLITVEDENNAIMGQNSIYATEEQALKLLAGSTAAVLDGAKFVRDDNVGIGL